MEWIRTSAQTDFRLIAGRPDIVTRGRWVFVPPGTPHYPGWHNLGSRDWTSDEREPWPDLGELPGRVRTYDNGQPLTALPPARLIGSSDCLANGERFPLPVVDRDLSTGFDSRCWPTVEPIIPAGLPVDVNLLPHQQILAGALSALYVDPAGAQLIIENYMGPGTVVTIHYDPGSLYPSTLIAISGNQTIVIATGTSNFFQLAIQAFSSGVGPLNFGAYGSQPLWVQGANVIAARCAAAGVDPNGPITFVGHSYGGACSYILAARANWTNPNRNIQLLVFGCPPPGDPRLIHMMGRVPVVSFVNSGDAVPYLPPDQGDLGLLGLLVPPPVNYFWPQWHQHPTLTGLFPGGVQQTNPPRFNWYTQVRQAVVQYATLQPITFFGPHSMSVYANNLAATPVPGDDVLPGTILPWPGSAVPGGYLACDGTAISRTVYSNIFAAIGITWGPGDGVTSFNLPDLRGRVLLGSGTGFGLSTYVVGDKGGQEEHQLSISELAAHTHPVFDPGHLHQIPNVGYLPGIHGPNVGSPPMGTTQIQTDPAPTMIAIGPEGADVPHENRQPYAAVLWIIKT